MSCILLPTVALSLSSAIRTHCLWFIYKYTKQAATFRSVVAHLAAIVVVGFCSFASWILHTVHKFSFPSLTHTSVGHSFGMRHHWNGYLLARNWFDVFKLLFIDLKILKRIALFVLRLAETRPPIYRNWLSHHRITYWKWRWFTRPLTLHLTNQSRC